MQMPRVQNRTHAYLQGIASNTLSGRVLSETNKGLTNNSGKALPALERKGMPASERKVKKTAQF
jgi:hypothetical protein